MIRNCMGEAWFVVWYNITLFVHIDDISGPTVLCK